MLLQVLPDAVLELAPATRVLNASNNQLQLTCISDQIRHFRQLQWLDLAVSGVSADLSHTADIFEGELLIADSSSSAA